MYNIHMHKYTIYTVCIYIYIFFPPIGLFPDRGLPQQKNTETHVCLTQEMKMITLQEYTNVQNERCINKKKMLGDRQDEVKRDFS